jgi:hypothetical protein
MTAHHEVEEPAVSAVRVRISQMTTIAVTISHQAVG